MLLEDLNIGLIEDDPVMGGSIIQRLQLEGCRVQWWTSGEEAIGSPSPQMAALDLVVCDIRLPDMNGEEVYRRLISDRPIPPFIFITGFGEIDQAVRLMRLGAVDYLTKPFEFSEFLHRIRDNVRHPGDDRVGPPCLGVSPEMRQVETTIRRYAKTDLPVLITGETGVGKEVVARFLHHLSGSDETPFMAVNCTAIPGDLLESEIYGHEKGAFTGALKRHVGMAERAGDGTLFLDEIGDMPPALQAKILRLIENREFFAVGGETSRRFTARVVAATHRGIHPPADGTGLRDDLYYRLSVLPLTIPPLRQRPADIPWLMKRFLQEASDQHGRPGLRMGGQAEEAAMAFEWPGNVRELKNRVERAAILAVNDRLSPIDLFPERGERDASDEPMETLAQIRAAAERRQIERVLAATGGRIQDAARQLGISRTTLWEKMSRFGLGDIQRSDN